MGKRTVTSLILTAAMGGAVLTTMPNVNGIGGSGSSGGTSSSSENNSTDSYESSSDSDNNPVELRCELLTSFLSNVNIPYAQELACNKIEEISRKNVKRFKGNHLTLAGAKEISSCRLECPDFSRTTEVESILDEGIADLDGDTVDLDDDTVEKKLPPILEFKLSDLKSAKNSIKTDRNGESKFFYLQGINALDLYKSKYYTKGSVVNLASQFNALESTSDELSSVINWVRDTHTQGPMGALQAIAAAKYRESAKCMDCLLDAIEDLLQKCKVSNEQIITDKYQNLYKNGYLKLSEIKDINDLRTFNSFLKDHVNEMNFLSQWARCEGSEMTQLQVFTAAPSFQGEEINWESNDERTKLLKECCITLVGAQYRALAQSAAIRSAETGENVGLHVNMVGRGAFKNPVDTIPEALKALSDELKDQNVTVYLHYYQKENFWEKYTKQAGISDVTELR